MNHLSDAQLHSLVFDAVRLTNEEATHLAECAECRDQLALLQPLANELAIARRSQPSAQALARYEKLFSHVQQQPTLLTRAIQSVRATLTWDSRQTLALQGVRNVVATHYRQLYTTERAEIELLVTAPTPQRRDIEGEIMAAAGQEQMTPALLVLQGIGETQTSYEAESEAQGRFRISNVAPGRYQLTITPAEGALLEIDEVEIE